jgi:hypothetical protein
MADNEIIEVSKIERIDSSNSLDLPESEKGTYTRFAIAALGSVPWIGGMIAGGAALHAEKEQGRINKNIELWLKEHEDKLHALYSALSSIAQGIDKLGEDAKQRIQEEDYLNLVKKGFRVWDKAETNDKKELVQFLLKNAAGTSVSDDDIVRLFIDWIDKYHEAHFGIIRAIYKNPGISLRGIWNEIGNIEIPRENSSSADLYRMLIHDLSTGRVIRQKREVNSLGQFMKKSRKGVKAPASDVMKSSFDNTDHYELSELGQEFVHYVLQDVVSRVSGQ